jgi:hypothetical protein
MNRRSFFRAGERRAVAAVAECVRQVGEVRRELAATVDELTAAEEKDWMESFFASYEESYSLTLAYPREFFEPMAEAAGIPHHGRETLDIVRDLYRAGKFG